MAQSNQVTNLSDPRMHIRTAYGTRAGAVREHVLHENPRTYQAVVDACDSATEADCLIRLARDVVYYAPEGEQADVLDRALGL